MAALRVIVDATRTRLGGAIQVALAVLRNAADAEGEWHAVVSEPIGRQLREDVKRRLASFRILGTSGPWSELNEALWVLPRIEREIRPDVVFTVFGPSLWRARAPQVAGFALPRLIYPEVRKPMSAKLRLADRWKVLRTRRGRVWMVETETVRRRMHCHLGVPLEDIHVVRNGYSPDFVSAVERDRDTMRPGGGFRILVPSAYYPHKNLEIVPVVSEHLARLGVEDHRFVFTLPEDRPEWGRIRVLAADRGVAERLTTLGAIPHREFYTAYLQSHAVFLPTRLECSTAVYPEAFCAERPVVTTSMDFAVENCGDGALYFDPDDAAAGAEGLRAVAQEPAVRERLIVGGRQALLENYPSPAEKWTRQLDVLREVVGSSKAVERSSWRGP